METDIPVHQGFQKSDTEEKHSNCEKSLTSLNKDAIEMNGSLTPGTLSNEFKINDDLKNADIVSHDGMQTIHQSNLEVASSSFGNPLNEPNPVSNDILDPMLCSCPEGFTQLTKVEVESLKSLVLVVNSLKVSNTELKQTVVNLTAKCHAIETTCKELQGLNRTLERELESLQNENCQTKSKLLQITSDVTKCVSSSGTTITKEEGSDAAKKQNVTDVESQSALTRSELVKLGTDLIGVTSMVEDINGKVTWLELEFQKFMRRHSLIIENLCPKEDKSATEMFILFLTSVLNVKIEDGEIESVHVITQQSHGGSPDKRPRPILVSFACYGTRSRVYKAWLGFRSSKMQTAGALAGERGFGICIREFLTELQDILYQEAIQVREKHLIADCWTFKGKTYIRTLEGDVREFNKEQWSSKRDNAAGGCILM